MTLPTSVEERAGLLTKRQQHRARLRNRVAPQPERGLTRRELLRKHSGEIPSLRLADLDQRLLESTPSPPPAASIALTRMGFGPRPGDIDAFNALGGSDETRMEAYVAQQLDPETIDDGEADLRLLAAAYETLDKTLVQLWQDHVVADPPWEIRMQPFLETERATFLRAVYSRRQLFEATVEFWHHHFNVYAWHSRIGPTWVYSDRDVIRANALGNFRQMLEAVAQSPGMLYYLNNRGNSADGPNENYARELLELHGLGAENFFGNIPQDEVPVDGSGIPIGYCDEDVTAAARCLTGWTLRDRPWDPDFGDTGEFFVHEPWHDTDAKHVLGVDLPAGQDGLTDGLALLDAIAGHAGTSRFIARKLTRRLIGDDPPQNVIDAAAAVFAANVAAPDQIARTLEVILLSPEFLATWADKIKRPFDIVTSALRAGDADWDFALDDGDTDSLLWLYDAAGQPLFAWHPPNGYPDFKEAWISSSPRVLGWRVANWLSEVQDDADVLRLDILGATPPEVRSAQELADFWVDRILGAPLPPEEHDEIVEFMAQGVTVTLPLPLDDDEDIQSRLRAMVGLIFMSPGFLWR